jgi:hypothetical protein
VPAPIIKRPIEPSDSVSHVHALGLQYQKHQRTKGSARPDPAGPSTVRRVLMVPKPADPGVTSVLGRSSRP